MVISCIYSICWFMKLMFYERNTLLSFGKRRKRVQISWMDASLIHVALECHDTGRLAYLYCGFLG
jgi:hypothetical protein